MTMWVIKKRGLFYRPNAHGYTSELCQAGLFTREQARERLEGAAGVTIQSLASMLSEIDAERLSIKTEYEDKIAALDNIERAALGLTHQSHPANVSSTGITPGDAR